MAARQRIKLTDRQAKTLHSKLARVPTERRSWASPEGQAFIAELDALVEAGVPITWIADELGIPAGTLYMLRRVRSA